MKKNKDRYIIGKILRREDIKNGPIVKWYYVPMTIGKVGVENMYFVYILQSLKTGRYYVGSTNDLNRRLSEHNGSKTKSLKNQRPLVLKFCKSFDIKKEAIDTERKIKKLKSREIIAKIVNDGELKMGL